MKISELRQMIREELKLFEASQATWEVIFDDLNLSGFDFPRGVELRRKNKYKVKARGTDEAIRKAAKEAGVKGNGWMAVDVYSVKKMG